MPTIALRQRVPYRVVLGSRIPRFVGHDCITLRHTIYCRHPWLTAETHAHEYLHVEQWTKYGVIGFLARYLWQQLTRGYRENRYEMRARLYARLNASAFRDLP